MEFKELTPQEAKARKTRNLAIAAALIAFVIIIFFTGILRMQQAVTGVL